MSDLEKVAGILSGVRGAYDHFCEAVGDEGEVTKEGRTIRYKATGGFYRWELYYDVVAIDVLTGYQEKVGGRNKERSIEEAIDKVLQKAKECGGELPVDDCGTDTNQIEQKTVKVSQSNAEASSSRPTAKCKPNLDQLIDCGSKALKHLGRIADSMHEWEGRIAEELDLGPADVAAIKKKHPNELKLQARTALEIWKERKGSSATYSNLMKVFERANYRGIAEIVRDIFFAASGSLMNKPSATLGQTKIKFSEDMSDDEFFMYLKNEHISDRDRVCLNENCVVAKIFLDLTDDDIENKLNISFGGKKIIKKLLKQLREDKTNT